MANLRQIIKELPFSQEQTRLADLLTTTDINTTDEAGYSLLMYAIAAGNFYAVVFLINKGANVNQLAKDGHCALHLAIQNQHYMILDYLFCRCAHSIDTKIIYNQKNITQHAVALYETTDNKEKAYDICSRIKTFCLYSLKRMDPTNVLSATIEQHNRPNNVSYRYKFENGKEIQIVKQIKQFTVHSNSDNDAFDEIEEKKPTHWLCAYLPGFVNRIIDDCARPKPANIQSARSSRRGLNHIKFD